MENFKNINDEYIFDFYADTNNKNKNAFNDALPIGNGSMGAMIYGGVCEEKLILNEDSVWLGKKNRDRYNKSFKEYFYKIQKLINDNLLNEAHHLAKYLYSSPKGECIYSVAGELRIIFEKTNAYNYKRIIDMENGIVKVNYDTPCNKISRTYFASYPNNVIVINIKSMKPLSFYTYLDREKIFDSIEEISNDILLKYQYNEEDTLFIRMKVLTDGKKELIGDNILVSDSLNTTIYITLRTTYYNNDAFNWCASKLENLNYEEVLKKHILDYSNLFKKQVFKTNDEKINYLYNFSRYLMISSSREFSQPANLQGIWCQDVFPAWDSKFTLNINLEMNYWNVFRANLISCAKPYFSLLKRIHKKGLNLAKEMFGVEGFVAFHNSDIYGDCAPQDKYMPATFWPLGGAWLSLMIYEYYLYTNDIEFLKEYENILNDSALFFKNILIENEKKELVVVPSLSPENSYLYNNEKYNLSNGCTMDSEILRDLFNVTISVNNILNIKEEETKEYIKIVQKLPKIKIASNGTIMEWMNEYKEVDKGHRHISHLYALYPSNQINDKTKELKEAANKTLNTRLKNGSGHTGWSKAWITCMYTRLANGNKAYKNLKEFIKKSTSKVGLDLHPPFQIDGNFGIASAISEMLVRDDNMVISLLPSIPKKGLENGKYYGLLLKGNIVLNMEWNNNKVTYIELINNSNDCKKIIINFNNIIKEVLLEKSMIINI